VIDWTKPAIELDRHIRAFNLFPGRRLFGGQTVKLWQASPVAGSGAGRQRAGGAGALAVSELQKAVASACRCSNSWPGIRSRWATVSTYRPDFARQMDAEGCIARLRRWAAGADQSARGEPRWPRATSFSTKSGAKRAITSANRACARWLLSPLKLQT
jgi:hypothetical protein